MEKTLAEDYNLINMINAQNGVLAVGSERMILFSSKAYVYLVRSVYQEAPHATKFLLYDAGYRAGEQFMGTLRALTDDKEALMTYAIETFKQAGYGAFELIGFDLDRPYIRVRGTNLFEASLSEEIGVYRTPRAVDHYSRGMLAGFYSQLLDRELVCEEMSCEARGDEACEFVVMPYMD